MTNEKDRKAMENSFRDWINNSADTDIYVIALVSSFEEYASRPCRGRELSLLQEAQKLNQIKLDIMVTKTGVSLIAIKQPIHNQ